MSNKSKNKAVVTHNPNKPKNTWNTSSIRRELPMPSNMEFFIRAEDGCYEIVQSDAWGACTVPVKDPDANTKLTYFDKNGIKLIDNFPKISKELWARIINLYFHFCEEKKCGGYRWLTDDNEVSVVFLRRQDDLTQWKVVVPKQKVSGASVIANFDDCVDIVTGEKYNSFPPVDYEEDGTPIIWIHAGSSHSHNTMGAFFSSTDDKSELGVPGLHIVVGEIDKKKLTYVPKASIVLRGNRKEVDIDNVVDTTPLGIKFHENCLNLIEEERLSYYSGSGYSSSSYYEKNGYYDQKPCRRGINENNSWVPGASWDNNKHCWLYHDNSEGYDLVTLKSGKEYEGRIAKYSTLGLAIRTESRPSREMFVMWSDILDVDTKDKKDKSLEDTDVIRIVDIFEDDDDDDNEIIILRPGYSQDLEDDLTPLEQARAQMFGGDSGRLPPMI